MKKSLPTIILIFSFFLLHSNAHAAVLINEFSSYDTSGDWIEIYSDEPADVDISGWYVKDDAESGSIVATVPQGTKIGPTAGSRFYVIAAGERLNRNEDTIYLYKLDNSIANHISYGSSKSVCAPKENQSAGRVTTIENQDGGNTLDQFKTATKGMTNYGVQLDPCPTPSTEPTKTPTPTTSPIQTPTLVPTKTPTPKLSISPSPTEIEDEPEEEDAEVLSVETSTDTSVSLTPTPVPQEKDGKQIPPVAYLLIGGGIVTIGGAGFLFLRNRKRYT